MQVKRVAIVGLGSGKESGSAAGYRALGQALATAAKESKVSSHENWSIPRRMLFGAWFDLERRCRLIQFWYRPRFRLGGWNKQSLDTIVPLHKIPLLCRQMREDMSKAVP